MAELTHFDADGHAQMVDISEKQVTQRRAVASARVDMLPATLKLIQKGDIGKGDVLGLARVAGIMGSKRTADLIPLCHPLRVSSVELELSGQAAKSPDGLASVNITSTVMAIDRTGVEMEALTAASVAALTIYDMCKAADRQMVIRHIQLEEKSGGNSGHFIRSQSHSPNPSPQDQSRINRESSS